MVQKLGLWSANKLYIIFVFCFLVIMITLYYWFDQKAGIKFTGYFLLLIRIKFGHAQISVSKISLPMSKTACVNPCPYSLIINSVHWSINSPSKTPPPLFCQDPFSGNTPLYIGFLRTHSWKSDFSVSPDKIKIFCL